MNTELSPEVIKEIEGAKTKTLTLKVVDIATYREAGTLLAVNKDLQKNIISWFKPLKQAADAAKKVLLDKERAELDKIAPNIEHLNQQMTAWNIEQEKIRKAEEGRLLNIAKKAEEDRLLQEALDAEAAGDKDIAAEIIAESVFVSPPIVPRNVPNVPGQTMVTTWKWKLEDINKVPRKYLKINEVALNSEVRNQKDATNIPGISVYPEHGMRGVRR